MTIAMLMGQFGHHVLNVDQCLALNCEPCENRPVTDVGLQQIVPFSGIQVPAEEA